MKAIPYTEINKTNLLSHKGIFKITEALKMHLKDGRKIYVSTFGHGAHVQHEIEKKT